MKKYDEVYGTINNIDQSLLNKTAMKKIDEHQMEIYEIMKNVFPDMIGYTAECHECYLSDGRLDVTTKFYMHRKECDQNEK